MPVLLRSASALTLAATLNTGCDRAPEDAAYGDLVPEDMLGRAVTVTVTDSDVPTAAVPGTTVVYRFLSNTRVLGEGYITLATQDWSYDVHGDNQATMFLRYGERTFEEYQLSFSDADFGTCTFHWEDGYIGGTPSGDPDEVREFNGTCEFRMDTTCAELPISECETSSACRWDALDPALPGCVPIPVTPMGQCPDYTGPTDAPQRDAQCKAAWAAECGGISTDSYCELFDHESWGSDRSCPYC